MSNLSYLHELKCCIIKRVQLYYRAKPTDAIGNLESARSISLQPGTDGNIFTVACEDNILRIFDIRIRKTRKTSIFFTSVLCTLSRKCNPYFFIHILTGPVLQTEVEPQSAKLCSVMFSPADPNLIAAAGNGGTRLFDIRNDPIKSVI